MVLFFPTWRYPNDCGAKTQGRPSFQMKQTWNNLRKFLAPQLWHVISYAASVLARNKSRKVRPPVTSNRDFALSKPIPLQLQQVGTYPGELCEVKQLGYLQLDTIGVIFTLDTKEPVPKPPFNLRIKVFFKRRGSWTEKPIQSHQINQFCVCAWQDPSMGLSSATCRGIWNACQAAGFSFSFSYLDFQFHDLEVS